MQVSVERLHHSLLLRLSREAVSCAFHDNELIVSEHLIKLVSVCDRNSLVLAAVDGENFRTPVLGRLREGTHVLG